MSVWIMSVQCSYATGACRSTSKSTVDVDVGETSEALACYFRAEAAAQRYYVMSMWTILAPRPSSSPNTELHYLQLELFLLLLLLLSTLSTLSSVTLKADMVTYQSRASDVITNPNLVFPVPNWDAFCSSPAHANTQPLVDGVFGFSSSTSYARRHLYA